MQATGEKVFPPADMRQLHTTIGSPRHAVPTPKGHAVVRRGAHGVGALTVDLRRFAFDVSTLPASYSNENASRSKVLDEGIAA